MPLTPEERQAAEVDARYVVAYSERPKCVDDIDSGRAGLAETPPGTTWDDLEW